MIKKLIQLGKKIITEIKDSNPKQLSKASFNKYQKPFDWNDYFIDKNYVIDFHPIYDYYFCNICLSLAKNPKCCK